MSKKISLSDAILALIRVREKMDNTSKDLANSLNKEDVLKSHSLDICAIGVQTAIEVLIDLSNKKSSPIV